MRNYSKYSSPKHSESVQNVFQNVPRKSKCSNRKHWKSILNGNSQNMRMTFWRTFWIFQAWQICFLSTAWSIEPKFMMVLKLLLWMLQSMFLARAFEKYFEVFMGEHWKNIDCKIQNSLWIVFIIPWRKYFEYFFSKHANDYSKYSLT